MGIQFPSPLGVSYFQIIWRSLRNASYGFRPLSGYLISKYGRNKMLMVFNFNISFRPLSGYLISKYYNDTCVPKTMKVFPSPLGVSYFQMMLVNSSKNVMKVFPSPLGVSYFQIILVCCHRQHP